MLEQDRQKQQLLTLKRNHRDKVNYILKVKVDILKMSMIKNKYSLNLIISLVLLISFVLLILLLPSTFALGLSGQKLGAIIYEPGKVIANQYTVTGTDKETIFSVGGTLPGEYISTKKIGFDQYEITITFPPEITLNQGTYTVIPSVQEVAGNSTAPIDSLLSVSKRFHVEVYSHEKEITASFTAPNVNEGNPVPFSIAVQSRSYSDIDAVTGEIIVYDFNNQIINKITTPTRSLLSLSSTTLEASFPTTNLPPANYWAKAVLTYDHKQMILNDTFQIGNLDLILLNYTKIVEQGFSDFKIRIKNNWGNPLENVYAKLYVHEKELLHTSSLNLEPWAESELSGFIKVELEPGEYDALLKLFYEGESKEVPIMISVVEKSISAEESVLVKAKNLQITYLAAILTVVLVIIIIFFVYHKIKNRSIKNRSGKKDDF